MQKHKNFIVIEGLDGSGKSTQMKLLRAYLNTSKIKFKDIHFPMLNKGYYGNLVAQYLRGEFGDIDKVHPKLVALLFAEDRKEHISTINRWLENGDIVIADRYVISNIAFQCAKCKDENSRNDLTNWILEFEFDHNKLPKPATQVFLDVPFNAVKKNLENARVGEDRDYLQGAQDIHENDLSFQEKVRNEYLKLSNLLDNFERINCADEDGNFLAPLVIHEQIKTAFKI